uniref:Protein transport protein sec16 n=1 Tax=Heterorhabditis bacteriophora TaxID=37862 RepID=A0A1I7XFI4_HETBA
MHQQQSCIPGQWDYVNLGTAPSQPYQWGNYAQQSTTVDYYHQQKNTDIKTDLIPPVHDNHYQKVHHTPIVPKKQLIGSNESYINDSGLSSQMEKTISERTKTSKHIEGAKDDECWDDDWERAEPESDVVLSIQEVTPSGGSNQTQLEPIACAISLERPSHEKSEAVSHIKSEKQNTIGYDYQQQFSTITSSPSVIPKPDELGHQQDQLPAVAQVAPILKEQVPELEYPVAVARVEPVSMSQSVNVQRVAPTLHAVQVRFYETFLDSEIVHSVNSVTQQQQLHETVIVDVPIVASLSSNPITEVVLPDSLKVSTTCRTSASANEDTSQVASIEYCITPEIGRIVETESPGSAQATSTPIVQNEADGVLRSSNTNVELHNVNRAAEVRSKLHPHNETQQPVVPTSADHSDSTQGSVSGMNGSVRKTVGNRCKVFKEQYSDIFGRLDQHRTNTVRSDFSTGSRMANPLMTANMSLNVNRRTLLPNARNTTNSKDLSLDDGRTYHKCNLNAMEKLNISNYSQPPPSLDRSIDLSCGTVGYGEDFVDAARRSRLNRSRPASHTKSEAGEVGPYKGFSRSRPRSSMYGYTGHSGIHAQQYYPGYYSSIRDPMIMPHADYYDQQKQYQMHMRRTQSTYDAPAYERFMRAGGRYGHYDAFNDDVAGSSVSDERSGEDDEEYERGECEEEVRRYTSQIHYGAAPIMSAYSVNGSSMPITAHTPGEEIYYFGAIHLDQDRVKSILYNYPPPPEYYSLLTPIEKAAYLFYASVYNKPYSDIRDFHNKFNREYYKFTCDGDTENMALWKICKSMKEEYYAKMLNCSQKAYEASQKQLFSDERDSIDGMSDRASVYDKDDDRTSDIMSIDSSQRAPLKHRTPHAFITFGPCGKMVTVHPDVSVSVAQIDDVKNVLRDNYNQRIIDAIKTFRGITFYNFSSFEHLNYLIFNISQRITGPDVARLLISASTTMPCYTHREKVSHFISSESVTSDKPSSNAGDPIAFDRFTHYLLGGHVDEAVDCALRDGLYADAIVLARRLFAGDARKLAQIEERFLATRPQCNPVMTLVSVASDQPAPILYKKTLIIFGYDQTNPPVDDTGSWRTHAAIVLANLSTATAMNTVYHLGRVLAKREYHSAADFCFLSVALLAGYDPFQPVESTEEESNIRRRIILIHAGLPDDEWDSTQCRFGFSLSDLHATEIFDYAVRLAGGVSPLANSIDYQRKRIQYAMLMTEYGGFSVDSFRYQWNSGVSRDSPVIGDQEVQDNQSEFFTMQPEAPRSRSESLAAEARDWHAERQDPLQMSPVSPVSPTVHVASVDPQHLSEFNVVRDRTDSIVSHHSTRISSYGERLCQTQRQGQDLLEQSSPNSFPSYYDNSYGSRDNLMKSEHTSEQTTNESTPIRKQASLNTNPVTQSHQQISSQQSCQDDLSGKVGLSTDNIKKSTSGSKGFFGNMKDKLMKAIPSGNEMILPDDSKPTIVWDATKGRYVGSGVEEEAMAAPPPKVDQIKQGPVPVAGGGLQAARTSGEQSNYSYMFGLGSRYFNPLNQASVGVTPSAPTPPPKIPAMPVPFGFIPTMPEDMQQAPLDSHRTLWMGDLQQNWDADFVAKAFKVFTLQSYYHHVSKYILQELNHDPSTVKMVTDKHSGILSGYCFVEFSNSEVAREAMLNANGNIIPNSDPPAKFNLSFANDPRVPSIEFNLFANNLHHEIDDADLYQVFGRRYRSCRGAKVYRNQDGSSRGLGFVRFGDQTEQQMALVEMNKTVVRGKEMILKLAAAKQRLPRHQIREGLQPHLISDMGVPIMQQHVPPPMVIQPPVVDTGPPEIEPLFIPTVEEANAELIENGDAWWEELEESLVLIRQLRSKMTKTQQHLINIQEPTRDTWPEYIKELNVMLKDLRETFDMLEHYAKQLPGQLPQIDPMNRLRTVFQEEQLDMYMMDTVEMMIDCCNWNEGNFVSSSIFLIFIYLFSNFPCFLHTFVQKARNILLICLQQTYSFLGEFLRMQRKKPSSVIPRPLSYSNWAHEKTPHAQFEIVFGQFQKDLLKNKTGIFPTFLERTAMGCIVEVDYYT